MNKKLPVFHYAARIPNTLSYETMCGRTLHRDGAVPVGELLNERAGLGVPECYLTCPECARAYRIAKKHDEAARAVLGNEE